MSSAIQTIEYRGERIVRERERYHITGMSRAHWVRLERAKRAPMRIPITDRTVGWPLSQIEAWVAARLRGEDWRESGGEAA